MSAGAVAGLKYTEAVAVRRFDEERIMGTNLRGASAADFTHNRGRRSATAYVNDYTNVSRF